MKEQLDQLVNDVAEIKKALVGDTKWRTPGLIKEVESLKAWRDKMNLRIMFWSGAGAVVVFALKAGLEYLTRK